MTLLAWVTCGPPLWLILPWAFAFLFPMTRFGNTVSQSMDQSTMAKSLPKPIWDSHTLKVLAISRTTTLPTHTPGGDERATKKTVEKRLFSRAKLHWNAESCLFSTQLTVTANVRNVALLKLGRSDTCDAENSATIALSGLSLHP